MGNPMKFVNTNVKTDAAAVFIHAWTVGDTGRNPHKAMKPGRIWAIKSPKLRFEMSFIGVHAVTPIS